MQLFMKAPPEFFFSLSLPLILISSSYKPKTRFFYGPIKLEKYGHKLRRVKLVPKWTIKSSFRRISTNKKGALVICVKHQISSTNCQKFLHNITYYSFLCRDPILAWETSLGPENVSVNFFFNLILTMLPKKFFFYQQLDKSYLHFFKITQNQIGNKIPFICNIKIQYSIVHIQKLHAIIKQMIT